MHISRRGASRCLLWMCVLIYICTGSVCSLPSERDSELYSTYSYIWTASEHVNIWIHTCVYRIEIIKCIMECGVCAVSLIHDGQSHRHATMRLAFGNWQMMFHVRYCVTHGELFIHFAVQIITNVISTLHRNVGPIKKIKLAASRPSFAVGSYQLIACQNLCANLKTIDKLYGVSSDYPRQWRGRTRGSRRDYICTTWRIVYRKINQLVVSERETHESSVSGCYWLEHQSAHLVAISWLKSKRLEHSSWC